MKFFELFRDEVDAINRATRLTSRWEEDLKWVTCWQGKICCQYALHVSISLRPIQLTQSLKENGNGELLSRDWRLWPLCTNLWPPHLNSKLSYLQPFHQFPRISLSCSFTVRQKQKKPFIFAEKNQKDIGKMTQPRVANTMLQLAFLICHAGSECELFHSPSTRPDHCLRYSVWD